MPVRNIWSLEPGECIVAEEIIKKLGCEVYFPVRDVGLDLGLKNYTEVIRALINEYWRDHEEEIRKSEKTSKKG